MTSQSPSDRPRTLRVAVNLLWCVPGEVGGSEEYLVRQLRGLAEVAGDPADDAGSVPKIEPTMFVVQGFGDAHPELHEIGPVVTAGIRGRRRSIRVAAEHTWLARRVTGFDAVHHGGGTVPAIGTTPSLLTIHDLQFMSHPEYHSAVKLRYLRSVVPRSARRATRIATPTAWVRSTVVDALGVEADRVDVVPHGVAVPTERTDEATLRRQFRLGHGPVIVYPAITHPHKGHRFLLEVMAANWRDPSLRLVLLGGPGAADDDVSAAIVELGLSERVVRPGRVAEADRDGMLALAAALVFPSEYEGFGAPLVEAMRAGTPVIAADHPAIAEVVGDAALVLPRTNEAWADALDVIGRRGDDLVAAGHRRAERYSIEASGRALAEAYRRVVGAGSNGGTQR